MPPRRTSSLRAISAPFSNFIRRGKPDGAPSGKWRTSPSVFVARLLKRTLGSTSYSKWFDVTPPKGGDFFCFDAKKICEKGVYKCKCRWYYDDANEKRYEKGGTNNESETLLLERSNHGDYA